MAKPNSILGRRHAVDELDFADLVRMISNFPYRMVAFDMDDTMLGPDKKISPANRKAVRTFRELGLLLVPCSGRFYYHIRPYHRSLRLQGPIVSSDGAVVSVPGGKLLQEIFLRQEVAHYLRRTACDLEVSALTHAREGVFAIRRSFWSQDADRHRELGRRFQFAEVDDLRGLRTYKVACFGEPAALDELTKRVNAHCSGCTQVSRHGPSVLEFTAFGVDKVTGLTAAAHAYNIDMSEIIAFGDGTNDATMLKAVGLGVAMHHGRDAAKEAADMVAPKSSPETNLAAAAFSILKFSAAHGCTGNTSIVAS